VLPNFLIIGAARSGTTTLYSHLQGHPDVYLPPNKRPEPHFFLKSEEYARGLDHYQARYFQNTGGRKAVGEASTSYLFGETVPARIRARLPDVKLIAILRNPIDRAFSSYWHTVKSGLETLPFEEAIVQEAARRAQLTGSSMGEIAPFAYLERGFYHRQLVRWLAEFPRDQMKLILFDDFASATKPAIDDIATFIGVDPGRFADRKISVENKSVPEEARISIEMWRELSGIFHEDVQELGKLLGRDLSGWLNAEDARGVVQ
jgi:Sulfotransferase domain